MTWNYRVRRRQYDDPAGDGRVDEFDIIEAYYADDGKTITLWCEAGKQTGISADSVDSLRHELRCMLAAFDVDVVEDETLPR